MTILDILETVKDNPSKYTRNDLMSIIVEVVENFGNTDQALLDLFNKVEDTNFGLAFKGIELVDMGTDYVLEGKSFGEQVQIIEQTREQDNGID